ncbi:YceI family protein [Luteimonas pelagia]
MALTDHAVGRSTAWSGLLGLLAAGVLALAAARADAATAEAIAFDPARSHIGFSLRTRWGQRLDGRFPAFEGDVRPVGGELRRVRIALDVASMQIEGYPRYAAFARGEGFFDAARHPRIEFESRPYPRALLRDGGELRGRLRMRGVERDTIFAIAPSTCADPGLGCDVVAEGVVDRTHFGMDRWRVALGDRVRFHLRIRLVDDGPGGAA